MPVIAVAVGYLNKENEFKIQAITIGCTQEEYDNYMKYDENLGSFHTVLTEFFTDFATRNHCTKNDIYGFDISNEEKTELIQSWEQGHQLSISIVKKILNGLNLSYHKFIDEYCEYLKSI